MRRLALAFAFFFAPVLVFAASNSVVPESSGSLALLSMGLIGVALIRRRQD